MKEAFYSTIFRLDPSLFTFFFQPSVLSLLFPERLVFFLAFSALLGYSTLHSLARLTTQPLTFPLTRLPRPLHYGSLVIDCTSTSITVVASYVGIAAAAEELDSSL